MERSIQCLVFYATGIILIKSFLKNLFTYFNFEVASGIFNKTFQLT